MLACGLTTVQGRGNVATTLWIVLLVVTIIGAAAGVGLYKYRGGARARHSGKRKRRRTRTDSFFGLTGAGTDLENSLLCEEQDTQDKRKGVDPSITLL